MNNGYLSGMIICQNEEYNIKNALLNIYDFCDEIIIIDGGSKDKTVNAIKKYPDPYEKIKLYSYKFTGHFGDQKNIGLSLCSGRWIFNLDADETLEDELKKNLFNLTLLAEAEAFDIECFKFARLNLIDDVLTEIYPDYQLRLFRSFCRYIYPVHEELVGYRKSKEIDKEGWRIIHSKTSEKQESQNNSYNNLYKEFANQLRMKGNKII